jgi:hypothetical protein
MKNFNKILQSFSLSCLLAGALLVAGAFEARANTSLLPDDNKDKINKKTEQRITLSAMPKSNLGLDAGYRYNGSFNSEFKLTSTASLNFKSVLTYKKGNVTYVLPYSFKMEQPNGMNYHRLQIVLPLK